MKLRLIAVLMVTLMANSAFAVYYWDLDATRAPLVGNWADANNWKATNSTNPGTLGNTPQFTAPMGDQEQQAYGTGAVVNVNTMNVFTTLISNRCRVYGGATMNVTDGGIVGMGWLRVGEKSQVGASNVNQTGGRIEFVSGGKDAPRLTLSDGNGGGVECSGYYNISGGTLTYDKVTPGTTGQITVGDRQGNGILHVIGTGGTIDMGALEMGGRIGMTARQSTATLQFDIVAGGVSAVQVVSTSMYAGGTNHLVTNLTEALADPGAVIVLVKNSGAAAVAGQFADWNGGYATEGAGRDIGGGNVRILTYLYNAETGQVGTGNDIALLVPEPATLALLSLGMFVIRRKK